MRELDGLEYVRPAEIEARSFQIIGEELGAHSFAPGEELVVTRTAEGRIAFAPSGEGGFGYDPIFEFPGLGTFADLTPEQKNSVSHRGKALAALEELLKERGML